MSWCIFVIRIHAGENDSLRANVANSIRCVREALSPDQAPPRLRIGHGLYTTNLHSEQGKALLREINGIGAVLEFQITSNVRLNNLSDLRRHPLKDYLAAGVRCVQGTDGGALYGTNSIDEELSLEKLLGLSHSELRQMRAAEAEIVRESMAVFARRMAQFDAEDAEAFYRARMEAALPGGNDLWGSSGRLEAAEALRDRIAPLPEAGTPVIAAGGSFSGDRRGAPLRQDALKQIDDLLDSADPAMVFFVIGHRLSGYERYLVKQNRGRFRVFAFVPTALTAAEYQRLRQSGVSIRVSIEASGNGVYKSVAYEIFKRRPSVLLAFDGKSPAANLVQEAKNARCKCSIFVDTRCRALREKGEMLDGYVNLLQNQTGAALADEAERIELLEHA